MKNIHFALILAPAFFFLLFCQKTYADQSPISNGTSKIKFPATEEDLKKIKFLKIKKGQTIHGILRRMGILPAEIYQLEIALKPYIQAKDIAPLDEYYAEPKQVLKRNHVNHFFIKKVDPIGVPKIYQATRQVETGKPAFFRISVIRPAIIEEVSLHQVTIKNSLYQSFISIPFGNELMQRLVEIFFWQLNLPNRVFNNDQVEILVNKKYVLGEFIGFGNILHATYKRRTKVFKAFYFASADNLVKGFFDENKKSLEKEFAYSPVRDTFSTSYQKSRLHPVLKIRTPHNGIDYRGAVGTEFFAIADGTVVEKRYDKNVGNMIRLKHKYGVFSEYFHAHKLENIVLGQLVKRGQKLGAIGQTGRLCTGPHLHLGLYKVRNKRRQYIDLASLRGVVKPAPDIDAAHMAEFNKQVTYKMALVSHHRNPALMAKGEGNQ